jgi:D-alanyl-D-alanine carboxypeptidase/D-alanyl-D-alanine-endopeptidase (penicillin-binding protein 4)
MYRHLYRSRLFITHTLLTLCLLLLPNLPANANSPQTELPPAFLQALQKADIPISHVGLVVWPLNTSAPTLQLNANVAFNPASTLKLVTSYAALNLLGPAYTWQTDILTDGVLQGTTLNGNLYLRGNGDPGLTDERFDLLLHELRKSGIQTIKGDLIIDQHLFQSQNTPIIDDHPWHAYNALPAATLLDYDSSMVTISNLHGKIHLDIEPLPPGTHLINRITSSTLPCDENWRDQLHTVWQPDNQTLTFSGKYSSACPSHTFAVTEDAPSALIASRFMDDWRMQGGNLTGTWREGITPDNAISVLTFPSEPLSMMLYKQNKYSNNIMARNLFLSLSPTRPATIAAADASVHQWLASRRLNFPELVLDNGSGLSRTAQISPNSMAQLLRDAAISPVYPELAASLPIYAVDGTLKRRQSASIRARAHLKTGTLDGVKALAGYIHQPGGNTVIVVLFINDSNADAGNIAQDALLDAIISSPDKESE